MIIIILTNNFADEPRVHLPIQYSINYFIVLSVTMSRDDFGLQIVKNSYKMWRSREAHVHCSAIETINTVWLWLHNRLHESPKYGFPSA